MMPSDIRTALETHLLRDALDATTDPVEIDDLDGRIVSVNDAWCRLFGRTREHVMGTPWDSTATNGLDVSELRRCWMQCRATGHSAGVFDLGRADGLVSRVSFARWLCWGPREGGDAVVTIYRPLSDNTGAQEPTLLAAAIQGVHYSVALFDTEGKLASANRAFTSLTGYRQDEVDGVDLSTLFPGASRALSQIAKGDRHWTGDVEITRKDGGALPARIIATPYSHATLSPAGLAIRTTSVAPLEETPGPAPDRHRTGTGLRARVWSTS